MSKLRDTGGSPSGEPKGLTEPKFMDGPGPQDLAFSLVSIRARAALAPSGAAVLSWSYSAAFQGLTAFL
jgi:hypothetical protein